ncbi:MAG: tRNA uridine-5-carboxymethylaminomethyl(34) synthesis enzyme MnmG [Bacteroides sp.]|nr:tRNA uridine-5-carboxymethylaminomethyl(34) synthesis enzyme MnmG [Prevotella sp.]MCM1407572.1 tRNA uridine-5-carboxymethylaminomethyl(34) synthesis enzyme MnmG [Treponema brennaborense]MCM1469278.1 tRNA uridine-5-carboxymethylaminomethyl(34) synthesis enzyme MnmG [Bacteroides sp.]
MHGFYDSYDIAVVGGGHAGIEASLAAARLGLKTILITQTVDSIGRMSCNPSIGGIAKGNIVREIDALGGEMAKIIDKTMIQFRMLNKSRGPAVQAPRAQADKLLYAQIARHTVESQANLSVLQDTVADIYAGLPRGGNEFESGGRQILHALVTERGRKIPVKAAVLTTGTFLSGRIYIGAFDAPSGRLGENGAYGLSTALARLGFSLGRLKTGTPPRVLKSSIDFSQLEIQNGDEKITPFSFDNEEISRPAVPCYLVYTNNETHRIIRENIDRSPLYSGKITGVGPRYCPSIEDKVMRFAERERHQLFVEPEGLSTDEMYINGFSSSLPEEVQDRFLRTLPGFKRAAVSRPGYAVEYDYMDPTQLFPSLETKRVAGLFAAGQINGTSGYEEAAGQGLVAGINAALYVKAAYACGCCGSTDIFSGSDCLPPEDASHSDDSAPISDGIIAPVKYEPLILRRDEAYIGVLIDDLVTLGTKEPYRMFTARAEHRLKLRQDTADERLCKKGFDVGLKTVSQLQKTLDKIEQKKQIVKILCENPRAENSGYAGVVWEAAQTDFKYMHYIEKQDKRVEKLKRMENTKIPSGFDYAKIPGLSAESRQKLEKIRPLTLGQANRISGIRNSDIMLLMVYLH